MKKLFTTILITATAITASADDIRFSDFFEDNTLRIDYIMGGDSASQYVQMEQLYKTAHWAGRRARLDETFLLGNGQLHVFDHDSGKLIFVHTFSTLFQEWQNEIEATKMLRAFEASYNVPFPKKTVDIEVTLTDTHNKVVTRMRHMVDPADILIRDLTHAAPTPYKYIVKNGDISDCTDIAIIAEGYTKDEMDKFYHDAQRAADAILSHEPFKKLSKKFNFVAVGVESAESGPSIPHEGVWHNTAFSSHYDTFYSDRYLTTGKVHRIFDYLAAIPFEHVIVLINTPNYGGGGMYNQWMCSSTDHPTFKQVIVHEFGHSYAGLADEYAYGNSHQIWYPADTEPWEPNITTLKDFRGKWEDLIKPGTKIPTTTNKPGSTTSRPAKAETKQGNKSDDDLTQQVGVYEGAGYQMNGCYRPAPLCRMNVNEVEHFCPVCTRAIERITEFYTAK